MAGFFAAKRSRGAGVLGSPHGIAWVAQRRGKNPDTMVSGGPVPSIGPTPEQGIGCAMHSSGPLPTRITHEEGRSRYEARSTRFTGTDMEIVPDRSVNTDEWPAACVDVARSARPGGTRSRHRRVLCSMSLAAPNSARANFTPISGALAG